MALEDLLLSTYTTVTILFYMSFFGFDYNYKNGGEFIMRSFISHSFSFTHWLFLSRRLNRMLSVFIVRKQNGSILRSFYERFSYPEKKMSGTGRISICAWTDGWFTDVPTSLPRRGVGGRTRLGSYPRTRSLVSCSRRTLVLPTSPGLVPRLIQVTRDPRRQVEEVVVLPVVTPLGVGVVGEEAQGVAPRPGPGPGLLKGEKGGPRDRLTVLPLPVLKNHWPELPRSRRHSTDGEGLSGGPSRGPQWSKPIKEYSVRALEY